MALTIVKTDVRRKDSSIVDEAGKAVTIPEGWVFVPSGDAALSRRIKAHGDAFLLQEKRGNKVFQRGMYAPKTLVEHLQVALTEERAEPAYERKLNQARARREKEQADYVIEFTKSVFDALNFSPVYEGLAQLLAERIALHATPVGSGTVARTERIPIRERAQAAIIAWMRHQTTAYDEMHIARVKGERRMVRRQLADDSKVVLQAHRAPLRHPADGCPLCEAVTQSLLSETKSQATEPS